MANSYRRNVVALVIELAKEDPKLVIEVISTLKATGEIEPGDLDYLEKIADRWNKIGEANKLKGRG